MGTNQRGILVIISSPSGAGKTTLARRLLNEFPKLEFSVSYTTRAPRRNEHNGRDYNFVDDAAFDAMVAGGQLAEWAVVHGNRYGTSIDSVERVLQAGRDVVFDVDWQGGRTLGERWPDESEKIFILPPDLASLEERLRNRATDSEEVIQRRLRKALEELEYHREYKHLIVNDVLDDAYALLRAVYLLRRYRTDSGTDSGTVSGTDRSSASLCEQAELLAGNTGGSAHARSLLEKGRVIRQE